jgi:1-acyl-sn-glycerol-3-phosphate acyltransferase
VRLKLLYWAGYSLTRILSFIFFRPRISGRDNIPGEGGFILASNHISYYDPPLVGSWQRREVYFFAKKELFRNKLFGAIITATNSLPVSRGAVDRQALRLAIGVIRKGFGLTVFPEGTRSRTDQFLKPRPGIGIIARQTGCPIVPAYIHGSNKLSDCFKRRDRMSITYGEPLSAEWVTAQPADKSGYLTIAATVMDRIAQLRSQVTGVK